ncbi:MAG: SagB/ThcOx family dehydrogenase [Candidatus Latescibacteria bacterium]|nr:SagB/ThcOx family dehydrogenase [Candidatus Latescibacterota bacterium]
MKSLKNRVSIKGFSTKDLPDQLLSDLLWSAFGVTSQKTGRRTAPSAFNAQEIDIYLLKYDGVYRYDAFQHGLDQIQTGDVRDLVAQQVYARSAPVQLVYVADYGRASKRYPSSYDEEIENWAMLHTGFIAQNVTVFCAVKGMCSVIRSFGNHEALRKAMKLNENQKIIITHAVGYSPK